MEFVPQRDAFGNVVWRLKGEQSKTWCLPATAAVVAPAAAVSSVVAPCVTFEVYQDHYGSYRWRMKAPDGRALAASVETFRTRADAEQSVETLKSALSRCAPSWGR